jgi:hypothetical protein
MGTEHTAKLWAGEFCHVTSELKLHLWSPDLRHLKGQERNLKPTCEYGPDLHATFNAGGISRSNAITVKEQSG